MGGGGSMHSMITILRNNKMLLRKISVFKKDHSFFRERKKITKYSNKKVETKKISKNELRRIREKVTRDNQSENLRAGLITFAIVALVFVFLNNIFQTSDSEKEVQRAEIETVKKEKYFQKQQELFYFFIDDGDKWIAKKKWGNAIYQYKNAVKTFPHSFEANYRLALAYSYNCKFEGKDCDKGNELVDKMLSVNFNNEDLIVIKNILSNKTR